MLAVSFPYTPLYFISVYCFFEISLRAGKQYLGGRWLLYGSGGIHRLQRFFTTYRQINNFEGEMSKARTFPEKRLYILFTIEPFGFGECLLHVCLNTSGTKKISATRALSYIIKRIVEAMEASTTISCSDVRQKQLIFYGL